MPHHTMTFDTEWLSDLIDCLQFFYQMTVKISGQMEALILNIDIIVDISSLKYRYTKVSINLIETQH
jgi:hypothetical protein